MPIEGKTWISYGVDIKKESNKNFIITLKDKATKIKHEFRIEFSFPPFGLQSKILRIISSKKIRKELCADAFVFYRGLLVAKNDPHLRSKIANSILAILEKEKIFYHIKKDIVSYLISPEDPLHQLFTSLSVPRYY